MIMDASFNVAMEPFRALVADNLPDSQRTKGFAIQAFLIGVGAVGGSYMTSILARLGFGQVPGKDGIAENIKVAFYIGAAIFVAPILITVFFSREYPPEEYERYNGKPEEDAGAKGNHGLSEIAR